MLNSLFQKKDVILAILSFLLVANTTCAQVNLDDDIIIQVHSDVISLSQHHPITDLLEQGRYGEAINLAVTSEAKYTTDRNQDSNYLHFYLDYANLMKTMLQIEDAVEFKRKALNTGLLSPSQEIAVRTSIAIDLISLNQNTEALSFVSDGITSAKKAQNKEAILAAYESMAQINKMLARYDVGLSYQKKCISLFMHEPYLSHKDSAKFGSQLGTLGELFLKNGQTDSAITYLTKSTNICLTTENFISAFSGFLNLSRAYEAKNDSSRAFSHATTSYELSKRFQRNRLRLYALNRIVELFGSFNYPISYTPYINEYNRFVQNTMRKEYKAQSMLKSGMSKAMQKKNAALEDAKETHDRLMNTILWLFGIISLMLFAVLYYVLLRFRRGIAQKEEEEKRQKEILRLQIKQAQKDLGKASLELERKSSLSTNIISHLEKISSLSIKDRNQLILFLKNELGLFNTNYDARHYSETAQLFLDNLLHKHKNLTDNDKELATLIVIGMSNKEMATSLNIQAASVKVSKNRLKKKLRLEKNQSLTEYLLSFVNL